MPNHRPRPSSPRNPLSPPSAPVQMRLQSPPAKSKFLAVKHLLFTLLLAATATAAPLAGPELEAWRATQASYDYTGIARAYADYMIAHGRDDYGAKHTPLFVTGMDRHTGEKISPPFAHVKRKPFMPGWERDRELRGSDRNYGQADPLDQLVLLKLMHRLTKVTGDKRYAAEADKTAAWWMANAQSPIGLYPWGTHTHWNVDRDGGGGTFEFNHIWPYWNLNPEALQKYAMGLWDHYIRDKETGDFNRHAHSHRHGPGGGMEFPWPGSAMIATWVEAYLAKPDPEYVRAIGAVLHRWESLRDENDHLAPCSSYGEWAWYSGYIIAANRLDDFAIRIQKKEPELAKMMRDYGRKNDVAFLKVAEGLLDVKGVGPVGSYLRETGGYNPDRLDIIGGPWQDRKDYAGFAVKLHERMKRNPSPELQKHYRRAVLDTAGIYMSINPEIQWSVWGVNMANAMQLMLTAHELTGNAAYLHRADHFARLAVEFFLDEASPLPRLTSQDDYYEIESITAPSGDVWMLVALEVQKRIAKLEGQAARPTLITTGSDLAALGEVPAGSWRAEMTAALAERRGGIWDCTGLGTPAASVALSYGETGERTLFLSRREGGFAATGLPVESLEIIASDFINEIPTLEETKLFNGAYRRKFSGKHREPSTARYGGFKDVLNQAGLLLVNSGTKSATVTVTTTLHDSWDDREATENIAIIQPGEQVLVTIAAPEKRFIRRLDFKSDTPGDVKLEQFAFAMKPRSILNPLSPPKAPPFGNAKPKLTRDGLVLKLVGETLGELADHADSKQRPQLILEKGVPVLRFDGIDDFLSISDSDTLDLQAWTMITLARAKVGPGVILGKVDESNSMMNYRLQIERDGKVGAIVRGASAKQQVNRQAEVNALNRFAVIAARFEPKAAGVGKITISVDGLPASYSYQNAEGELTAFTHNRPLLIGRQPGNEARHFKGDLAGILLFDRALGDEELNSASRWLFEHKADAKVQATGNTENGAANVPVKTDEVKEVRYPSSADHSEQPAMFYAPPSVGPVPLIVALHSWSANYKQDQHKAIEAWCVKNGWAYIHPDFRGPNNRPQATGSNLVVADIVSAVEYAKKATRIDNSAVYLVGTSGGGYTALLMAGRHPDLWAGVSAWVPISDLKAWYHQCEKAGRKYSRDIAASCGGPPGLSPAVDQEYARRSPLTHLKRAKGLTLHLNAGIRDGHQGSVPISHSLLAFNEVAEPKDLLSAEDIQFFVKKAAVPPALKSKIADPGYGTHKPLFRRESGNATITIFDGGHELVAPAAIAWIEQIHRKKGDHRPVATENAYAASKEALVFLIAGQSNAGGVAAFSPESNIKSGMAKKHPTIPGSTAKEAGIPITVDAYPRSSIWGNGFERLTPGKNLKGGYHDPNRHGIELPMAMLLEKSNPNSDVYFIKHGPGGHNLHTQWKAGSGPDYKNFKGQLDGAMADLKKRYQNVRIIGLYWDQGESDRPKAMDYGKNLRAVFNAFRKDSGIADLPIFVRKHLFQHGDESFVPILEAQIEVTMEDSNAHLLDLDLGTNEKNFKAWAWTDNNGHLSSKAYLELSRRILVFGERRTTNGHE